MLVSIFEHVYMWTYTRSIYRQSIKKIEEPIWSSVTSTPSTHPPIHPIKLAFRADVNPALVPGSSCKGLVETSKGLFSLVWIIPQLSNLTSNFDKKGLWSFVDLKDLTFSMNFQKHISLKESWKWNSHSPTWHQIFKPITMLVTNFEYVYK